MKKKTPTIILTGLSNVGLAELRFELRTYMQRRRYKSEDQLSSRTRALYRAIEEECERRGLDSLTHGSANS